MNKPHYNALEGQFIR